MHEVDVSKKGSTWGKEHSFQGGKEKNKDNNKYRNISFFSNLTCRMRDDERGAWLGL